MVGGSGESRKVDGFGAPLCLATGVIGPTVHEDLSAIYCERAQCSVVYAIVCERAY